MLLGGVGNPTVETHKTIQELYKDANSRYIRFNNNKPDKCNISSETTPTLFVGEMREHFSKDV